MDHTLHFPTQHLDSRTDFEAENHGGSSAGTRAAGSLGKYKGLCSPTTPPKKAVSAKKISRFRLQRFAAENVNHGGLRTCMWTVAMGAGGVAVRGVPSATVEGEFDKTRFGNLSVCGSHICPVCGPRVARRRRDEVEKAVKWGQSQGLVPVMLTLTTRHGKADRLDSLINRQRSALRRLKRHRSWRQSKGQIPHMISAFEETHGGNGWHPHAHIILFIACDSPAKALRLVATLRKGWTVSAAAEGLSVGRAGFTATVADGDAAKAGGRYLTKSWGLAEEMTLTHHKKAADNSRTPRDLLVDAYGGDSDALGLWQVWALAVKGKSTLRFSQGLKAAAGIREQSDKEAATVEPEEMEVLIDHIDADLWEQLKAGVFDRDSILRAAREGREAIRDYLDNFGCYRRKL